MRQNEFSPALGLPRTFSKIPNIKKKTGGKKVCLYGCGMKTNQSVYQIIKIHIKKERLVEDNNLKTTYRKKNKNNR